MNILNRLIETINLLIKHWYKIGFFCLLTTTLGAIYIFSLPRTYTSEVIMVPEVNKSSNLAGNMSSLASMAGIRLGGSDEDALYPEFYPKVLSTNDALCDLIKDSIFLNETKMPLLIYLTKHQREAWWSNLFSSSDKEKKKHLAPLNPRKLSKEQEILLQGLKSSITCFVDKRTNMVTINADSQDPEVSAQLASLVQNRLQKYITDYRTNKARNDMKYMEAIVEKAEKEYKAAQKKYAVFADANQELILQSVQQEEVSLENKMQLAYNAYSQSVQQLQIAQAKVQESMPAFTILQAASIPTKPSAPKRVVFVAFIGLLSFLISSMWIIAKDGLKKYRIQQKMTNTDNLKSASDAN